MQSRTLYAKVWSICGSAQYQAFIPWLLCFGKLGCRCGVRHTGTSVEVVCNGSAFAVGRVKSLPLLVSALAVRI